MAQEKTNILLVDDKPARLLTYEAILESLDQNLVRAESGNDALQELDRRDFAAILLDVNMPGMDGFETAARIRAHRRGAQTPIIFVTGVHVSDFDRLRGYEMGAADYVYVPVVPQILRSKVQVLIQLYLQRLELSRLNERLVRTHEELARAHEQVKAENMRELQKLNRSLELANNQLRSEIGERRRAEKRLRESARRKDEFISILAHELRNPLAAIVSGVELMRLPGLPTDKVQWAHELVERQLQHLVRLIDDLLDVSRITTGRVQLQRETVDLVTVLTQSMDAIRPLIDERRHAIELHVPEDAVLIEADAVRLSQVFGNLLTNASKYMDDGGHITVALELLSGPERAVVRIRDRGEGLSADMLERVFELFTQAHPFRDRSHSGLGIGLALVRGLVELHGGVVRATSDGPGHGSQFEVELPLSSNAGGVAEARPRNADEASAQGTSLRLLIVDDNVDAANGLALHFKTRSNHQLWTAHTGASGIRRAIELEPDLLLLDIGLPDMDGYEVARRLRAHPVLGQVGLVAMTGFGGEADRRRAEEAGFDHFLVKPVAFQALEALLTTWPRRPILLPGN